MLVRRAVSADLLKGRTELRSVIVSNNTSAVPRSDLCHALGISRRHLPRRDELQPYSGDTHLIEQALQVRVLGGLAQHLNHTKGVGTSCLILSDSHREVAPIPEAEAGNVALLLHPGKLHHRRTTRTTKAGTPIPSVGTGPGTTVTTVYHFWEWWWHHLVAP
ncbi:Cap [Circular ssDNA virus sp.]|nr:Cap [Circular ssDNA virus sp.]